MSARKRGFDPVVDAGTRVLVLGSLPGDASLAAGQYYAHPRNAFWRLMGQVIDDPELYLSDYAARLAALRRHGVGLWDVIVEAQRIGSLDGAIRLSEHADIRGLIAGLPHLRAVGFNGAKAALVGRRFLGDEAGVALIDLPSSSPAHARPLSEKAAAWSILRAHLQGPLPTSAGGRPL